MIQKINLINTLKIIFVSIYKFPLKNKKNKKDFLSIISSITTFKNTNFISIFKQKYLNLLKMESII